MNYSSFADRTIDEIKSFVLPDFSYNLSEAFGIVDLYGTFSAYGAIPYLRVVKEVIDETKPPHKGTEGYYPDLYGTTKGGTVLLTRDTSRDFCVFVLGQRCSKITTPVLYYFSEMYYPEKEKVYKHLKKALDLKNSLKFFKKI